MLVEDDFRFSDARAERVGVGWKLTIAAIAVAGIAVPRCPKFGATGSVKDARGSFSLFTVFQAVGARHHIEGRGNLFHDGAANDRLTRSESIQQRIVTKVIDVARNPFGTAKDVVDRARRKDIRARGAGDLQT